MHDIGKYHVQRILCILFKFVYDVFRFLIILKRFVDWKINDFF